MTMRVCLGPAEGQRCPTAALTHKSRCHDCERAHDKARGTSSARGYDSLHQARRAEWAPIVEQGGVICWRCEQPIKPGSAWHLGHDDVDRRVYRGPECVPCNTATSTRRGT